jgi:hypothetical protein
MAEAQVNYSKLFTKIASANQQWQWQKSNETTSEPTPMLAKLSHF